MRLNNTTRDRRRLGFFLNTFKGHLRPNLKISIRPNRRLINFNNVRPSMHFNFTKHPMRVPRRIRRLFRPRPIKRPVNVQRMKSSLLHLQTKSRTHSLRRTLNKLRRAIYRFRRHNLTTTIQTRRTSSTTGVGIRISTIRNNLLFPMNLNRVFANRSLARTIFPPFHSDYTTTLPPTKTCDQYYTFFPRGLLQYFKPRAPTIIQSGQCPPLRANHSSTQYKPNPQLPTKPTPTTSY